MAPVQPSAPSRYLLAQSQAAKQTAQAAAPKTASKEKQYSTTKIALAVLAVFGLSAAAYLAYNPVPLKQALQYVAQTVTPQAVKDILPTAFREAVRNFANS
jgi:hypothetical protein